MKAKIIKVMEEDWHYLIILDACRYDYFSSIYKFFFSGELYKGISLSSSTPDWCMKSFTDYYSDVIYISGNPYINSKIKLIKNGFDAKRHFYKVIDAWDFCWNERVGVVLPEKINAAVLSVFNEFPEKRMIIHFLQPHEPYISEKFQLFKRPKSDLKNGFRERALKIICGYRGIHNNRDPFKLREIFDLLNTFMVRANLTTNPFKLREILNLPPACPMDAIRRLYGIDGLREAYKENLRIVLENVAKLCNELLLNDPSVSIVISSDHGERLGENAKFGHWTKHESPNEKRNPILIEIPWFRVKCTLMSKRVDQRVNTIVEKPAVVEERKIRERLEKLGYI